MGRILDDARARQAHAATASRIECMASDVMVESDSSPDIQAKESDAEHEEARVATSEVNSPTSVVIESVRAPRALRERLQISEPPPKQRRARRKKRPPAASPLTGPRNALKPETVPKKDDPPKARNWVGGRWDVHADKGRHGSEIIDRIIKGTNKHGE